MRKVTRNRTTDFWYSCRHSGILQRWTTNQKKALEYLVSALFHHQVQSTDDNSALFLWNEDEHEIRKKKNNYKCIVCGSVHSDTHSRSRNNNFAWSIRFTFRFRWADVIDGMARIEMERRQMAGGGGVSVAHLTSNLSIKDTRPAANRLIWTILVLEWGRPISFWRKIFNRNRKKKWTKKQ